MSEKVSRLTKSFFNSVNECFAHSTSTQIHLWSPPKWTRCPADVVEAEVECPSQNVWPLSHRWGDMIKRKLCSHAENSGEREQPATSSGHAESSLFRLDSPRNNTHRGRISDRLPKAALCPALVTASLELNDRGHLLYHQDSARQLCITTCKSIPQLLGLPGRWFWSASLLYFHFSSLRISRPLLLRLNGENCKEWIVNHLFTQTKFTENQVKYSPFRFPSTLFMMRNAAGTHTHTHTTFTRRNTGNCGSLIDGTTLTDRESLILRLYLN